MSFLGIVAILLIFCSASTFAGTMLSLQPIFAKIISDTDIMPTVVCSNITNCAPCQTKTGCGWCGISNTCEPGSATGSSLLGSNCSGSAILSQISQYKFSFSSCTFTVTFIIIFIIFKRCLKSNSTCSTQWHQHRAGESATPMFAQVRQ